MAKMNFCPECGTFLESDDHAKGQCYYCQTKMSDYGEVKPEVVPDHCDKHPRYEGVGVPKDDCLTCWLIHKSVVSKKVEELRK